eukprot:COSAG02_NODE_10426_length_1943_cov_3.264100_2_plen_187_part_00
MWPRMAPPSRAPRLAPVFKTRSLRYGIPRHLRDQGSVPEFSTILGRSALCSACEGELPACQSGILWHPDLCPNCAYCARLGVSIFHWFFISVQSVSEFLWDRLRASIQFHVMPKRAQYARFSGEDGPSASPAGKLLYRSFGPKGTLNVGCAGTFRPVLHEYMYCIYNRSLMIICANCASAWVRCAF